MKRKHPEYEQRRTTKRSLRGPLPSKQVNDERRPERHDVYLSSESSPDSQDGFHPQNSGDECELEVNGGIWNTPLPHAQHPLFPGHDVENSTMRSSGSATAERNRDQVVTGSSVQGPSINESDCMGRMVQDAIELERSLLLGTSFLKPTYELDDQLPSAIIPQSASFDTNLAGCQFGQGSPGLSPSNDQGDWLPSPTQITQGCDLFFKYVSHFLPFLHQPTFDATHIPLHLLLSILSLGYQHGEDPDCGDQVGSGASLSIRCFHQARAFTTTEEGRTENPRQNTSLIQSYLLLQICAMMYLCGDDSASGLKMHSNMISLARAGGLMQPMPTESSTTEDLEALWREFIKAESHKRTSFAVHQIDALWYQFLSIPRSISHLEVKHDLPCPEAQWTASSAAEWAHRHLVTRNPGPAVPYPDAVRRFLSSDANPDSIPTFDPYGAINIAQFLISSAREVSGWSTMTGMLSMDRLDALRSSLISLGPFIRPQPETTKEMHATATWETAMIELHLWSPAHTGGIVAASLDAVVSQSTSLAPSYEFLWEADTAKAIQPHVDWFIRYLDTTVEPDLEAPWVAVYAYKAFLIAWQLVRGGIPNAMLVAGIQDGDVEGALEWARKVFRRRQRWQLGRLILSCLDGLGS
ncbi:fungal-specific transcription factor domain-containing protein [Aspergillus caelatus]|uniref:Fungal-specific transcription factor domain-containing protein n=1 Tax=Aspergillus caelatus TaxID=61420 RepID=A0A5N7ADY5_9EURO|nr:fungal-specific transcription factor domain-containing protein [Aspergillus caelatus]KAE8368077.1 fungal-specific transcription factor domain-containing protein [Aspergillus caelatus]